LYYGDSFKDINKKYILIDDLIELIRGYVVDECVSVFSRSLRGASRDDVRSSVEVEKKE
jgi:hypothetical protein